ncbi:asparaginyl-tRNA synthetase [Cyclonatronum proteinivorum]|uniref:Asparagine--tRNA ligase n=1 Tax=Cyclonatronum proteinivorum TaxID=1457365 RepID=A0A345UKE5_9BACT|nr:asparagine--tRNA ligase [Cyclonatronum proteinivorum]AXJ00947.1 asparaginyl-tRNA synthetase [Cyclonatronum proteinivorum]
MTAENISTIQNLHQFDGQTATLQGWVQNIRSSKSLIFVIMRDGSGLCQCIVSKADVADEVWEQAGTLTQESSLRIKGNIRKDDRSVSGYELHVQELEIIQIAQDYPITPKEHGVEFLMENRHLWLRSQRQWAAMRVRNRIIFAIHEFFQQQGFVQLDAPIFTGNAAEGTTNLFETDYFDQKAYLSQSGQLYGEAMALAHGKIYTFGPTFRAEKSKTRRHLTEFWMVEPEMAFYDLKMNMDLAEDMVVFIVEAVLRDCRSELETLGRDITKLEQVKKPFPRITYTEAVELLSGDKTKELLDTMERENKQALESISKEIPELEAEHGQAKKGRKFQIDRRLKLLRAQREEAEENLRNLPVWRKSALETKWGDDFGGSDETLLTMHFDRPIMVHGYPAEIKAFYMKRDPNDDRVALGVDVLAPEGYGEMIGGAQREDDLETLRTRIAEHELDESVFSWYLDLRRFGTVPHSGFGLGLERTVAWICGLSHVRETIPFPRMLGRLTP